MTGRNSYFVTFFREATEASDSVDDMSGAANESRERHVPREGEKANRPRDAAEGRGD